MKHTQTGEVPGSQRAPSAGMHRTDQLQLEKTLRVQQAAAWPDSRAAFLKLFQTTDH